MNGGGSASNVGGDGGGGEGDGEEGKAFRWSADNELILVEWGDIAKCYEWLHAEAHRKYSRLHAFMSIPIIVLSTFSGTASFAQTNLPARLQAYAPLFIGSLSICIGVISTLLQFLQVTELKEAYRISAMAWGKFARNIELELSKQPPERANADQFFKVYREKFDRLTEASALVPADVVRKFLATFAGQSGSAARRAFEEMAKPAICNAYTMHSCRVKTHASRSCGRGGGSNNNSSVQNPIGGVCDV